MSQSDDILNNTITNKDNDSTGNNDIHITKFLNRDVTIDNIKEHHKYKTVYGGNPA